MADLSPKQATTSRCRVSMKDAGGIQLCAIPEITLSKDQGGSRSLPATGQITPIPFRTCNYWKETSKSHCARCKVRTVSLPL